MVVIEVVFPPLRPFYLPFFYSTKTKNKTKHETFLFHICAETFTSPDIQLISKGNKSFLISCWLKDLQLCAMYLKRLGLAPCIIEIRRG